ncbi:hypothetical protein [uncultured Olleya sp.]|uniref:DUF6891 domain-containing protein n=1 Tax=uncultured Olleya sp. TaxID=757243 RepID=UPI00259A244A|nr:hypothetical protein [uncultured Olleya sp.]
MNKNLKNEVIEQLEKDILFGFENEKDLIENISDMFYDEEDLDLKWLTTQVKTRLNNHYTHSLNWDRPSDFDRLVKAFDQLNTANIVSLHKAGYTKQDGRVDCHEIINELKSLGITSKGYCFYHTQDLETAISNLKTLYIAFDSYNQDDELAQEVAKNIIKVLKDNGFKTKWNGSLDTRIAILDINWQKTIDNIDYNYTRIFDILKANTEKSVIKKSTKKPFWKIW